MRDLNGRVAVVTGAGSGIGQATAVALARQGCQLALVDIDEAGMARTRGQLPGVPVSTHVTDVSDADQMASLPDQVVAEHGACHILVNNAGVTSAGRFEDDRIEDIEWLIGINVWGVLHGCRAFLPLLRQADEAHIVNLSSMVAFAGLPQNAVYALSKGAVRSFTEALRGELATSSIGVTAVYPGAIRTQIMHRARGAEADRLDQLARSRLAPVVMTSPETVARRIVAAIRHDRARTLIGPDARVLDLVTRLAPGRTRLVGRALDRLTR